MSKPAHYSQSNAIHRVGLVTLALIGWGCSSEPVPNGPLATLEISLPGNGIRQGDVTPISVIGRDSEGREVANFSLDWSIEPHGAGAIVSGNRFVGYQPGQVSLIGSTPDLADTVTFTLSSRGVERSLEVVGQGWQDAGWTTDLWLAGNYAYTGSIQSADGPGGLLYVWDVTNPALPTLASTVQIDAATLNDVKIHPDGRWAVVTHESSSDGKNGFTLLDLADPANPTIFTRHTAGLQAGVHNVWFDGSHVYAVADDGPLVVFDISDRSHIREVSRYYAGSSFTHDVYLRDGLAFVSHWDAGLVILDVGRGLGGGSPARPLEVARVEIPGFRVHNAWYWPAAGYVFIGDELTFPGQVLVVDVRQLEDPVVVASYQVDLARPHNFWLDEAAGLLYVAWYQDGLHVIDVSGELAGRLDLQGRTVAQMRYSPGRTGCFDIVASATCSWAPALHGGHIYVSDVNSGLWVLRLQ